MGLKINGVPSDVLFTRVSRATYNFFRPITRFSNWAFGTKYYDLVLATKICETSGDIVFSQNVVVYLIYPKEGVLPSHILALKYFLSKGFTPIVVSNVRLNNDDKKSLATLSYKIIERPNYGYDFGGYRDGILSISQELSQLDRLIIMNDSCWFPATNNFDWIEQVSALNVDFAGAASNEALPKSKTDDFENLDWDFRPDQHDFHYGSFALHFSKKILSDPLFFRYWKNFRITNNKMLTIERGERGMTRWAKEHGFTHDATVDMSKLYDKINACSPTETLKILSDSILLYDPKRLEIKSDLLLSYDKSEVWANRAKLFILSVVANQSFVYTLPGFGISDMSFPFLKKSPVVLDEHAANRMLRIAKSLQGENRDVISKEIEDIRAAHHI